MCLLISVNVAKQEGEIWLIWSNQMLCSDLMPVMFGFIYHIFYYASYRKTFLKYYSSDKEKKKSMIPAYSMTEEATSVSKGFIFNKTGMRWYYSQSRKSLWHKYLFLNLILHVHEFLKCNSNASLKKNLLLATWANSCSSSLKVIGGVFLSFFYLTISKIY